jgi:putative copper export protein
MGAAFDLAVALARALIFAFSLQAVGALLFLVRLPADCVATSAMLRRLVAWSAGIGIVLVVVRSTLEPMRMAGHASGAVDPLLVQFFWQSNVGLAQVTRVAGLVGCLALCVLRPTPSKSGTWLAAALVVVSFALMGHTRSHDPRGGLGALLTIHLFAAAYWFGALLPLYVASARESGGRLTGIVQDFSRWAVWLVPAMLVAGAVIGWRLLGSFAALSTPYGTLLLVKLGGFAMLVALGAVNRYRLTPALAVRPQSAASALRRVIGIELVIMVVVLVATAAMTTLYSPELPAA